MAEPLVSCIGLVKIYPSGSGRVQALRGVDLDIPRGGAMAVIGPSGSGKSSLLRIIAGLDEPTAGTVVVDGVELAGASGRRRRKLRTRLLSHVYQRPSDNLVAHLTARQQLERVAVRRGHGPDAAMAMLDLVGLGGRADHRPAELSGGEQQRLAFARAAVGAPPLIIADEPTAELDTASSRLVLDAVDQLVALGTTVVLATHDARVLERIDHVVTLRDGAVSAVEHAGRRFAAIDHTGRLQLPPEHRRHFGSGRASLGWDDERGHLTATPGDDQ